MPDKRRSMFTIKNLRKEKKNGWTYLKVDFDAGDKKDEFSEDTIWFAVENKNSDMLTDDVYDAFVPFILYLGMYYHRDVHIKGKMSPRLYHNITHYLMKIFDNYSDYTQPIKFTADGFKIAKKGPVDLVGTGISCGVDSLTTIYDNFIETEDESLRLNSLFMMNCGDHGKYKNKRAEEIWQDRIKLGQKVADELDLPMFLIDSNTQAFSYDIKGGQGSLIFIAKYCGALALQKYVKRYLTSSGSSYDDCSNYSKIERDKDISSYCETYMPHLISTERFELIIDGCQYTRSEKVEKICDWDIAKKYLNVCVVPTDGIRNCSACPKCVRTLLVLESLDKLEDYKDLFDLEAYRKNKAYYRDMLLRGKEAQGLSLRKYLKNRGSISSFDIFIARPRFFYDRVVRKIKRVNKVRNREQKNV